MKSVPRTFSYVAKNTKKNYVWTATYLDSSKWPLHGSGCAGYSDFSAERLLIRVRTTRPIHNYVSRIRFLIYEKSKKRKNNFRLAEPVFPDAITDTPRPLRIAPSTASGVKRSEGYCVLAVFQQLGRRNLSDDQRAVVADSVRERRAAISKQGRATKGGHAKAGTCLSSEIDDKQKPTDSRKAVAAETNLPENKLKTVMAIKKSAPELIASVRAGGIKLSDAKKLAALPSGEARSQAIEDVAYCLACHLLSQIRLMTKLGILANLSQSFGSGRIKVN